MVTTKEQSIQALSDAKKLLDDLKIPFCLFLGTSLGAYRDGTFCPGDEDDIDLAISDKYFHRLPEIREAFKDWDNYANWIPEDGKCPEISFKRIHDGCYTKVDLFFISEFGNKVAWRFYLDMTGRHFKTKYIDKKFFDKFDKVNFFGEEYNIPGDIEEYLVANYGKNWKTPIHRDNWNWSEDNKADCTADDPLVSIIIPVWGDYVRFLPECLDNVKQQTYKNIEIIVVDNKTDLPSARNEGIKRSKGEYILCLDVDDLIDPKFIEKTIGKDDIVGTGYKEFGDHEIYITPETYPTHEDFKNMNQMPCTSLFKREIWDTVEGFDEGMTEGYEDWDFWLQATKAGYTVTNIPEILFYYRRHGVTLITGTIKKHDSLKEYMINKLK